MQFNLVMGCFLMVLRYQQPLGYSNSHYRYVFITKPGLSDASRSLQLWINKQKKMFKIVENISSVTSPEGQCVAVPGMLSARSVKLQYLQSALRAAGAC